VNANGKDAEMQAILDDNGDIIGIGEDERAARKDAVNTLENEPSFIRDYVDGLTCKPVTDALGAAAQKDLEVSYRQLKDGTLDVIADVENA
jgi:hypothetical protein